MNRVHFPRFFEAAIFLALAIFVLYTQSDSRGFITGHHGWVSSHTLSIISHTGPESNFVGYSMAIKDEADRIDYDYFDRSPILFANIMKYIISFADEPGKKIYIARQAMNVIFVLTMWVSYLILIRLLPNPALALSAVLLTASGHYFMYYKDMVDITFPGVLGVMLCIYGIVIYKQTGRRLPLYLFSMVGTNLGFGFSTVVVVGLWFLMEALDTMLHYRRNVLEMLKRVVRMDASKVLILCILVAITNVVYNSIAEAKLRRVSFEQTSIVASAIRRGGLASSSHVERPIFEWKNFIPQQVRLIMVNTIPYLPVETLEKNIFYYSGRLGTFGLLIFGLFFLYVIVSFVSAVAPVQRMVYILLLLSGVAWLFPMRHLAAPHNYTSINYFSLVLVFYLSILDKLPVRTRSLALAISLAVFIVANMTVNRMHSSHTVETNEYTADFDVIRKHLVEDDNLYIDGKKNLAVPFNLDILGGRPYAMGFYFPQQYLTPLRIADYSISANPYFGANNLTPENRHFFLFRNEESNGN